MTDVKQFERRHFELNNPLAAGLFCNQEELDESAGIDRAAGKLAKEEKGNKYEQNNRKQCASQVAQ
jgi:hypothetical protein